MRSLCLNVELEGHQHQTIDVTHDPDEDELLGAALPVEEKVRKADSDDLLGSITAELGNLMGEKNDTDDLIGKGEEN